MVLTAFASAEPKSPAAADVCADIEAQVSMAPSDHKAQCWRSIGMGKLVPACPAERAILTVYAVAAPLPHAEAVPPAPAMRPTFIGIGFDPPPPKV